MYKYQIILSDTEEFYKHYLAEQVYFLSVKGKIADRHALSGLYPLRSPSQLPPAMELRIPEACFLTSGIQTSPFSKRPLKKRRDGLDFKNPRDRMAFLIRGA